MPNREMRTFTTRVIDPTTGAVSTETFDVVDGQARGDLSSKISEPSSEGTNGQVLTTDGNGGRSWTTISTEMELNDIQDVTITTPTAGQTLAYDATAEEWKNASADSAPTSGSSNFVTSGGVYTALDGKVDKITGKGLSTNDFTDTLKDKLDDIEPNAEVNVQADWAESDTTDDAYIANKPTTVAGYGITDAYTKTEVDNLVSEVSTSMVWKAAVDTYADIATTYPSPSEGWTVNVTSTNRTYRYDGSEWVLINANTIPVASTTVDGLMGSAMVTKLNGIETGAEVNQNAFATVKVGNVSVSADAKDDTVELVANNVTITPDATNDKITIGLTDSNVEAALGFTPAEDAVMVGATASANGQKGLVPAPTSADGEKLLYGNGTWGAKPVYTPAEIGTYSDDEIDNLIASVESNVVWKPAVSTYEDLELTYPNPEEGWTVNVTDINQTYRYNGTEWVLISANVIPSATTTVDGLMTTTMVTKLNGIEAGAQVNVIPDFAQTNSAAADFIKNKPTLGTASAKDVPTSGDATNAQVVLGSDSRLSDARPASDVSAWAKAATKPTYTATEVGGIASTEKGTASGVAELDANGKVPSSQLPSYVDDVKEGYLNSTDGKFYEESTYETEIPAEADKIYVDKATNITYRWSGSAFVPIGSDLALGETSTTAYRGDRGKIAYDHATDANKISAATASGFYKVGATAEGHVSSLTAVAKADITALGIPDADDLGTAASKDVATSGDASASQVVMGNDSRLTDARNAADVSAWAKAATKPTYTASEVGLGNVGNFKAVSTVASQGLTDTEKANARTNIGAGTSTFSGAYNDLTGKPTLGTAAAKNATTSVTSGSADVVTSDAVYTYVDTVITQALNGSY